MARTQARVSRSLQSTVALSATAVAIVARTLADSTSYCCAPASAPGACAANAAQAARKALVARRRLRIHEARLHECRRLRDRHACGGDIAAMLVLDDAVLQSALADDDAMRDADELLVGEEDPGALVAIVEEDLEARTRQFRVELFRRLLDRIALPVAERDHGGDERRHRIGPDDAFVVVVLLDRCGDDARDADAVAAHLHRLRLALLVDVGDAHLPGIRGAKLEDVAHLDAARDLEPSLAVGRRIARDDVADVGDGLGLGEVAPEVDARQVEAFLVRAGAEVAHRGDGAVGDDANVVAYG